MKNIHSVNENYTMIYWIVTCLNFPILGWVSDVTKNKRTKMGKIRHDILCAGLDSSEVSVPNADKWEIPNSINVEIPVTISTTRQIL